MKKLMTILLGLSFLVATVPVSFAQDTTTKPSKKHKGKKNKKNKKSESTKGGGSK